MIANPLLWPPTGGQISTPEGGSILAPVDIYALSRPAFFTDPLGLFEVDPSCDECLGKDVGTPSQPTKRTKLIMEVHRACTRTLGRITDLRLRRCIEISCNEGTIECRDNCPPDKGGHNPFTFFGVTDRDPYICVNNWSKIEPHLGDLLIHEWAHGCHWGHWMGKGVPGNTGGGFD